MTHTDDANIGLEAQDKQAISDILQKYLATEIALNLKIRNYHWNVEGMVFNDLHKFFEELYDTGADYADEVAERIRMLGIHTHASMAEYIKMTIIPEEKEISMPAVEMLKKLLDDTETIIREMRQDITKVGDMGDQGTEDFLTALIQKHEKDGWMIRSLVRNK
ncbi:DNA starvation/stationary phase protection protein [Candidatus Gracilibacteria bacterium]|nr:DNA starvation/stationary phase protection protein [Candidatus Gracilibacteria bacterium]